MLKISQFVIQCVLNIEYVSRGRIRVQHAQCATHKSVRARAIEKRDIRSKNNIFNTLFFMDAVVVVAAAADFHHLLNRAFLVLLCHLIARYFNFKCYDKDLMQKKEKYAK